MAKLTISLVTYNSERYLRDFCDSLHLQTFLDFELIVIDNASYDHSVTVVTECMPRATIVKQKENIGFSKAHNLAITWSKSEYVLVVNPDFIFDPHCLERLIRYADSNPGIAAVGPKLLSWDHEAHEPTGFIDSCGIRMTGPYRSSDNLQGQKDVTVVTQRVFGLSGACVMYRRSALEDVKVPRFGGTDYEYFDEDFFLYKEDVDLAWRLNLAAYEQYLVADAIAYHQRTVKDISHANRFSYLGQLNAATRHERKKRSALNRFAYRNHLLTVYKDQIWSLTLPRALSILWFEAGKFVYLLFLDGSSIRGLIEAIKLLPKFRKKRALIQKRKRIQPRDLALLLQ
jgi:GT2 family glycosyltransferase